jgi:hypothetical protein
MFTGVFVSNQRLPETAELTGKEGIDTTRLRLGRKDESPLESRVDSVERLLYTSTARLLFQRLPPQLARGNVIVLVPGFSRQKTPT